VANRLKGSVDLYGSHDMAKAVVEILDLTCDRSCAVGRELSLSALALRLAVLDARFIGATAADGPKQEERHQESTRHLWLSKVAALASDDAISNKPERSITLRLDGV
jgi:hypothetical protein